MKKKVLVTGGAGFIGSNLSKKLLDTNHIVYCLDNLSVGTLQNIKGCLENNNFSFIKGDVRDERVVKNLIIKSDIVFHLAAVVGVSIVVNNPLENISVNIEGTRNIAYTAQKYRKKVVFASSSEVYGKNSQIPLNEDTSPSIFGPTNVTLWAYGLSKSISEHLLLGLSEKGLPISIVRYFNCYGPNGTNNSYTNVVPKFIKQAIDNNPITVYGDGKQTRCFCYVDDTVRGTLLAAENESNGIYNIGSNKEITINKLAALIRNVTSSKSPIIHIPEYNVFKRRFESSPRRVPDIRKSKRILHFSSKIDLKEGLLKTVSWMKANT